MTEVLPTRTAEVLPTGTVTVLSVDLGDPAWPPIPPVDVAATTAGLDCVAPDVIAAHRGVGPAEHDDSTGLIAVFACASDAVLCALALQRAMSPPPRLHIGVDTGELDRQSGDHRMNSTINRATHLRKLAHSGQILLSGVTADLVADRLSAGVRLIDLGGHALGELSRPERVVAVRDPALPHDVTRAASEVVVFHHVPVHLTSFIGRGAELAELRQLVDGHRLVTLAGAGGVGKTRLAVRLMEGFGDAVWWVDLAPLTEPDLVAVRMARSLGLRDQPGRSTLETLRRYVGDRRIVLVLDNCEHLLDGCAALVTTLLAGCAQLTVVTTSREPIGIPGEVVWRVPSLALADDAIALFADRARLARPDFTVTADNVATVTEICRQLDGVPLAIELAAARVRALTLDEILDGLRDRFRLLTGGARSAVARQQTLRASVDWSYALLSPPEQLVFRRLAAFLGGFDLAAACAVAGGDDLQRYQVVDALSLLIDKSLVVADSTGSTTRYRLLETVRHYALEKLAGSGEADAVRTRHRDHYTALFDTPIAANVQRRVERAIVEINNLRAAFAWSREHGDVELAARLASSLQPLWLVRGRIVEGLTWFDAVLADSAAAAPAARARALADVLILDHLAGVFDRMALADEALAIARELDDPDLLARVLTACGVTWIFSGEIAERYFTEAIAIARTLGDDWQLSWILAWQADLAYIAGRPSAGRAAAEEGRHLADAIGDGVLSRMCGWFLGCAHWLNGDLADAAAQFADVTAAARAAHDPLWTAYGQVFLSKTLAYQGDIDRAQAAAESGVEVAADLVGVQQALSLGASADAFLAAGDVEAAATVGDAAWRACPQPYLVAVNGYPVAQAALAQGDITAARRWSDEAVSMASGAHRMILLATHVRVAIAEGDVERAERDIHDALAIAAQTGAYLTVPDIVECLAGLAGADGKRREAARLFGAAQGIRNRTGQVRFKIYDADYQSAVATLHDQMTDADFNTAWAAGVALSTDAAIAYAQRGHGERRRPATGWAALTPTESDVVRLVCEGLSNKDIGERLFVSPRTVQTHLTHIYTKLAINSRVQLAQEAAQHA